MQTEKPEPIVRSFEPTAGFDRVTRIGNTFVRPLLRSRFGKRMHDLALLSFTGRKSGRRYTIPVAYHELDGDGVILTAHGWRANLRGGADVEVVHDGVSRPMRAELVEDPHEVARIYEVLLHEVVLSKAKLSIGLEVVGNEIPTEQQIEEAVGGRRAVVLLRPR
jgi:F420H(2)-dependent quinone reductase